MKPLKKAPRTAIPDLLRRATERLSARRVLARDSKQLERIVKEILYSREPPFEGSALYPFPTGKPKNIIKFGGKFLGNLRIPIRAGKNRIFEINLLPADHESHLSLGIYPLNERHTQFEIKLGFSKDIVFVEAIQGPRKAREIANAMTKDLGTNWSNYLLEMIEQHAKKSGYQKVCIRDPRKSQFFWHLDENKLMELSHEEYEKAIDRGMDLREKLGQGKTVRITKEEKAQLAQSKRVPLTVKGLNVSLKAMRPPHTTMESAITNAVLFGMRTKKTREHIANFYSRVAQNNGYTHNPKAGVFEKAL